MSKRSNKTLRLSFLRRKIHNTFKSPTLKAALLAELEERGEDAGLVIQMVERVRPITEPPVQAVVPVPVANAPQPGPAPGPNDNGPQPGPAARPRQAPAPAPIPDGNSVARAYEVLDSEDELVQDLSLTPRRERRLRDQLQSWRSSSSE